MFRRPIHSEREIRGCGQYIQVYHIENRRNHFKKESRTGPSGSGNGIAINMSRNRKEVISQHDRKRPEGNPDQLLILRINAQHRIGEKEGQHNQRKSYKITQANHFTAQRHHLCVFACPYQIADQRSRCCRE